MGLEADLEIAIDADNIEFEYSITNLNQEPEQLEFRSGCRTDVAVFDDGTEVWRWSDDRMFTQSLETVVLGAGESMTNTMVWDDPRPGDYTVEATVSAVDEAVPVRREISI